MDAQPCQRAFFAAFYRPLSMLSVLLGAAFGPALVLLGAAFGPPAVCVTRRGLRPACGLCYSARPSARLRFVLLGAAFGPPAVCVTRGGLRPACGLCYSGRPSGRLRRPGCTAAMKSSSGCSSIVRR